MQEFDRLEHALAPEKQPLCFVDQNSLWPSSVRKSAAIARQVLQRAEREAERIFHASHSQAQEIIKEARTLGYAEGEKQALTRLLQARAEKRQLIEESRQSMLEIVFAISGEVICSQLELHPDTIIQRIRRALEGVVTKGKVNLAVSPQDADYVRRNVARITSGKSLGADLVIIENKDLRRGDAEIELSEGITISANVYRHLAALKEHFCRDTNV